MLLLLVAGFSLPQKDLPKKVLFVGNSYTYFWNLPQQVAAMAKSRKVDLETRQTTAGGVNLGQHWRGEKKLRTMEMLRSPDFDFNAVVIQDHSMRSIEAPDSMVYFGKLIAEEVQRQGASLYVYITWAREFNPYMQQTVTEQYLVLAEAIGAQLLPVGPAWAEARKLRPDLPLYDADQSHPSPLGSYLSACVCYAVLTGESPIGLPKRLTGLDADGEKIYLNIQSEGDALFCQTVADQVVNSYRK